MKTHQTKKAMICLALKLRRPSRWLRLMVGGDLGRESNGNPQDNVEKDTAQAKRIGWRLIFRWLQAQLALIQEAKMVDIKEVFLPYHWNGEQTYYELFLEEEGIKLLE